MIFIRTFESTLPLGMAYFAQKNCLVGKFQGQIFAQTYISKTIKHLMRCSKQRTLPTRAGHEVVPNCANTIYSRICANMCLYAGYADMRINAHRQKRAHGQPYYTGYKLTCRKVFYC